ncbi:MAG TPA: relaxase [Holosporales bacterium]|nr:relaxase [Holosporales bacterium]
MILKGSSRANGTDLASHLSNKYDNEIVDIAEVRGTISNDLHGAFSEYEAVASGTKCTKPFYSLSINPSDPITRKQYFEAINHIEKRLGLLDQPRTVVFHIKNGREHAHVIWSRIRAENMKAIHISHDHLKLRTLARELAHQYNLRLPPGLKEDRPYDIKYKKMSMNFAEKAQAEQTGITPNQRKTQITALYNHSSCAPEFKQALEDHGYTLAKGDKRSFVIIDPYGEVHSLSRQIDGVKPKNLKTLFAVLNPSELPAASEIQKQIRQEVKKSEKSLKNVFNEEKLKEINELEAIQLERRNKLNQKYYDLELVHRTERFTLHAAQFSEGKNYFSRIKGKVYALIHKVPALCSIILHSHRLQNISVEDRHKIEHENLITRHKNEKEELKREGRALDLIEKRELRSLEQKYLRMARTNQRTKKGRSQIALKLIEDNALDLTTPAKKEEAPQKVTVDKNSMKKSRSQQKKRDLQENLNDILSNSKPVKHQHPDRSKSQTLKPE